MQYRRLGETGVSLSVIGFGASPLGDVFRPIDRAQGERAVHAAIDAGINLFDVSPYYGLTLAETRLGEALGGKRDRVFLATKCGRYGRDSFDFSRERVTKSIDESLRRLRTDHVDLLQVHDVEFGDASQIVHETLPALADLRQQGKTRFIGITGYPLRLLASISAQTQINTILSYCRYNLMIDDLDALLTPFARGSGTALINASPLHMGLLTDVGAPAWHPAPEIVKQAAAEVVRACNNAGVSAPLVALRFCLDHSYITSTLVGMSTAKHVENNLRALETDRDPALMERLQRIVAPARNFVWESGRAENSDREMLAKSPAVESLP